MGSVKVSRSAHTVAAGPPSQSLSPTDFFNVAHVPSLHLFPGPGHHDLFWLIVAATPLSCPHPSVLHTTAEPSFYVIPPYTEPPPQQSRPCSQPTSECQSLLSLCHFRIWTHPSALQSLCQCNHGFLAGGAVSDLFQHLQDLS